MTEKAEKILNYLKRQDGKAKLWRLFRSPGRMDRILEEFNKSTLDDVSPLGQDRGMSVLKDMNALEADHDEFVKSLAPSVDAL